MQQQKALSQRPPKQKKVLPKKKFGRRKKNLNLSPNPAAMASAMRKKKFRTSLNNKVALVKQEPENPLEAIGVGKGKNNYQVSGGDLRDPRQTLVIDPSLHIVNQNGTVQVQVPTDFNCVNGIITAMVSHAIISGYYEYLQITYSNVDNIGYVYQYIGQLIESVLQGGIDLPKIQVPVWLNDLLSALTAKSANRFGTGYVGYKFVYKPVSTYAMQYPYPYFADEQFLIGTPTSSVDAEGYVIQTPLTLTYTATLGGVAFNDFKTYMRNSQRYREKMYNPWNLVDLEVSKTVMSSDTSVFAFSSTIFGGANGVGGPSTLVSLEVFNRSPLFSVFAADNSNVRAFRNHKPMSGDSNSLYGFIMLMDSFKEYNCKNYIDFKFCDLAELIQRMLLWVQRLCVLNAANVNNKVTLSNPVFGFTVWDFAILMRHIAMENFAATQYLVQTQYPVAQLHKPQTFVPLLCSTNTAPRAGSLGLQIPLFMAENLKALRGRKEFKNVIPGQNIPDKKNPTCYFPVLGLYEDFTLDSSNWTFVDGETTVSLFATTITDYDLVSGLNGSSQYVDLDMSPVLYDYAEMYNQIIQLLAPYAESLTVFDGEKGINALQVIGMTFAMDELSQDRHEIVRSPVVKEKKKRLSKGKSKCSVSLAVSRKLPRTWTSQQPLLGPLAPMQKLMWIPEIPLYSTGSPVGSITSDSIRTLYLEPYLYRFTNQYNSSSEELTMEQLRKLFVDRMVHSYNAQNNETTRHLLELAAGGHGGIFNQVVQAFSDVAPVVSFGMKALGTLI